MTPQSRRLLVVLAVAVPSLLAGRAVVDALSAWWWAASISPEALATMVRWRLLELTSLVVVLAVAVLFWWGQYLGVRRCIAATGAEEPPSPETRTSSLIAAVLAGALALLTVLLHEPANWAATVALARADLTYGATDPLLGRDLGRLIADQPLTQMLHRFALRLAVLGLLYILAMGFLSGTISRERGRIVTTATTRFLIGRSLLFVALLICLGYLLAPARLAVAVDVPLDSSAAEVRINSAYVLAGISLATALLTIPWLRGGRGNLMLSGWGVLALATLADRIVVPAFVAGSPISANQDAERRRIETLVYGLDVVDSTAASPDTTAARLDLWDESALASWIESGDERFLGAVPIGDRDSPRWLVAAQHDTADAVLVIREANATAAPLARFESPPGILERPTSLPGASSWSRTSAGVRAGSLGKRLALAWSLQGIGILSIGPDERIDWIRDPQDRLERLVPPLVWRTTGMLRIDGDLHWVVSGFATVRDAPLATRVTFDGREVSGVVPALVATVRANDGRVVVYRDPAGGPLGRAWARAFERLVRDSIPRPLLGSLQYPAEWFARQLTILSSPHWNLGVIGSDAGTSTRFSPVWGSGSPGLATMLEDADGRFARTLVVARRDDDGVTISAHRVADSRVLAARDLAQAWNDSPELSRLSDSVRASGDSVMAAAIRWRLTPDGPLAWRPVVSLPRRGPPRLLWVSIADSRTVTGARLPEGALASLESGSTGAGQAGFDWRGRLGEARTWMLQGDSALGRGDLTAFGRSWEALRRLLLDSIPE